MAISPISSVSFRNNYNQVNFGGKREEKVQHSSSLTNTLRSIPLATLIALSPLNTAQAQTTTPKEEIVFIQQVDDSKNGSGKVNIWFISTDGDDSNVEKVLFTATDQKFSGNRQKRYTTILECEPKTLKTVAVTRDTDFGVERVTEYYVSGPGKTEKIIDKMTADSPVGTKLSHNVYKHSQKDIKISKDMYNYLKEVYGDDIEYTNESKVEDGRSVLGTSMEGIFD